MSGCYINLLYAGNVGQNARFTLNKLCNNSSVTKTLVQVLCEKIQMRLSFSGVFFGCGCL